MEEEELFDLIDDISGLGVGHPVDIFFHTGYNSITLDKIKKSSIRFKTVDGFRIFRFQHDIPISGYNLNNHDDYRIDLVKNGIKYSILTYKSSPIELDNIYSFNIKIFKNQPIKGVPSNRLRATLKECEYRPYMFISDLDVLPKWIGVDKTISNPQRILKVLEDLEIDLTNKKYKK